jgi:hypothetical protein
MISDDDKFRPEDMAEMSDRLESIVRDSEQGYMMEFIISRQDAKELVKVWEMARDGDEVASLMCLMEYGKIMIQLGKALRDD